MTTRLVPLIAVALTTPLLAACATKGWVKDQLANSTKVSTAYSDSTVNAAITRGQATRSSDIEALRSQFAFQQTEIDSLKQQFHAAVSQVGTTIRFALPVNFAFNDATVSESDHDALDRFASVVTRFYNGSTVTVEGFTDPAGTRAYNLELSKRRADNVAQYLATKGLDSTRVRTVGYGKERLVHEGASHDDPGAAQNRRAVFVVETTESNQATTSSATTPQ